MGHEYDHYRRPMSRRQRQRRAKMFVVAATLVGFGLFATYTRQTHDPSKPIFFKQVVAHDDKKEATPPPFTVTPTWPEHVAAAAIGIKGHGTIASYGQESQRPTASIAKVITALAILEKKPLTPGQDGPMIKITPRDEQRYNYYVSQNGSVAGLKAGTSLSQRQILEAMLLPSANDAADAGAIWAFGSLAKYHDYANDMLARQGLTDTVVGGDASGLSPKTKSTTRDLVKLGELALDNPVIAEIVRQHETSSLPLSGPLPNYNRLVTRHGYSGIKLGDSNEAGITLLFSSDFSFQGKKYDMIGVVLGASAEYQPQESAFRFMESAKASARPR